MAAIGLGRRLLAEFLGTALLVTVVVGSGIAAAALSPSSTASIGPSPRTSPTPIASSRERSCAPSASERSRNSGAATVSSTTQAAAQATGLPPNVPPRPPGCTASISSARPVATRR